MSHNRKGRLMPSQRADVLHILGGVAFIVHRHGSRRRHKYLYTLAPVVADLLRLVVPDWADQLDLAAPEDVSTEYLDEAHRRRVGDMAWKVRFRDGELADGSRPYILLLVEFQSTADRGMARRIREYTDMLLDRLIRNDVLAREGDRRGIPLGADAVGAGAARPGAAAAAALSTH